MTVNSQITVTGLKELYDQLQTLPAKIEANVMRGALRAGQIPMREAARAAVDANGSIKSGDLRKSIRISVTRKSEEFGWIRVKLLAGDKTAWYARLVEFGTASFYQGKGHTIGHPYKIKAKKAGSLFFGGVARDEITHPGIRPRSFMRVAFDAHTDDSIRAVADYITKRLPKELNKVGK